MKLGENHLFPGYVLNYFGAYYLAKAIIWEGHSTQTPGEQLENPASQVTELAELYIHADCLRQVDDDAARAASYIE
jgi:hypothetical protein